MSRRNSGLPDAASGDAAGVERQFLERAIAMATANAASGQLPFAALVVRDGAVLATGMNTELADVDPVAHAEVAAIREGCRTLGERELVGATVVSSCEPCAMCHVVATSVGVARIVYAAPKELVPDLGGGPVPLHHRLVVRMQAELRSLAPEQLFHAPIAGADEPFREYLARTSTP